MRFFSSSAAAAAALVASSSFFWVSASFSSCSRFFFSSSVSAGITGSFFSGGTISVLASPGTVFSSLVVAFASVWSRPIISNEIVE